MTTAMWFWGLTENENTTKLNQSTIYLLKRLDRMLTGDQFMRIYKMNR